MLTPELFFFSLLYCTHELFSCSLGCPLRIRARAKNVSDAPRRGIINGRYHHFFLRRHPAGSVDHLSGLVEQGHSQEEVMEDGRCGKNLDK